jgi:hypothetical protein
MYICMRSSVVTCVCDSLCPFLYFCESVVIKVGGFVFHFLWSPFLVVAVSCVRLDFSSCLRQSVFLIEI